MCALSFSGSARPRMVRGGQVGAKVAWGGLSVRLPVLILVLPLVKVVLVHLR